jgi:hypothetical protein
MYTCILIYVYLYMHMFICIYMSIRRDCFKVHDKLSVLLSEVIRGREVPIAHDIDNTLCIQCIISILSVQILFIPGHFRH